MDAKSNADYYYHKIKLIVTWSCLALEQALFTGVYSQEVLFT